MRINSVKNVQDEYDAPELRRSRGSYMAHASFEYFITLFVTDAFLAKLLSSMGISDATIGIVTSLTTFSTFFQFIVLFIAHKIRHVKRIYIITQTLTQLLFMSLYLLPFIPIGSSVKTVIIFAVVLTAYLSKHLVSTHGAKWSRSFINPKKMGSYFATCEMISLAGGMILSFVIGLIIDRYDAAGDLNGGFIFTAISIFVLNICNLISILLVKRDVPEKVERSSFSAKVIFQNTLGNRKFVSVIIVNVLWVAATGLTTGFLGTYKTKDLALSVTAVQLINIAGNSLRFFLSKPFGRIADKYSFARGMEIAFIIAGTAFLICSFTSPATWWLIIPFTLLFLLSHAGTVANFNNITYDYVDLKYYTHASLIKNCIAGIVSLLASLAGSAIVTYIQGNGNMLFGIGIHAQQVLAMMSFMLVCAAFVVTHFFLVPKKS